MSMKAATASAVTLLVVLSGCAFAPVKKPDPYGYTVRGSKVVELDSANALDAARSALEGLGYEVAAVNPDLRFVRSKTQLIPIGDACWCGRWNGEVVTGNADSVVTVTAKQASGASSSLLEIEHLCSTTFTGTNLYGATTVKETYQCASKGWIEDRYWQILDQVLQARGVAPAR